MPTCEFCNKSFARKYNFNVHQQTAKYCLKLQENEIERLKNREKELNEIIKEKDKIIKQKDQDMREITIQSVSAPRTNITVNNNNNRYNFLQTFNLSAEYIKSQIDAYFTENHFLDGQKGVAIFTHDNLIRDNEGKSKYFCSDLARRIFIYKNVDGLIQKDFKSETLTNLIANDIIAKSCMMYQEIRPELTLDNYKEKNYVSNLADIKNLKKDNTTFAMTLARLACNVMAHENGDITYEILDRNIDGEEIIYVIEDSTGEKEEEEAEEDDEEEEDLSKYTPEYFARKEALIEKEYRENCMYKLFKRQLEEERARYGGEKNREKK